MDELTPYHDVQITTREHVIMKMLQSSLTRCSSEVSSSTNLGVNNKCQ